MRRMQAMRGDGRGGGGVEDRRGGEDERRAIGGGGGGVMSNDAVDFELNGRRLLLLLLPFPFLTLVSAIGCGRVPCAEGGVAAVAVAVRLLLVVVVVIVRCWRLGVFHRRRRRAEREGEGINRVMTGREGANASHRTDRCKRRGEESSMLVDACGGGDAGCVMCCASVCGTQRCCCHRFMYNVWCAERANVMHERETVRLVV